MKKIVALLLTVLMVTSTMSAGFSAVYADESHTSEIMTDVPESTEASSEPDTTQELSTEEQTDSSQEVTDPTEETQEQTEETAETDEPDDATNDTEEETSEEITQSPEETTEEPEQPSLELPKAPQFGDKLVGDFTGEGIVNITDVSELQKCIAGFSSSKYNIWGDTNGDGELTVEDATIIQKWLAYGNGITAVELKKGRYSPEKGKVTNLESDDNSQSEINLVWDQAPGASGYEIFVYSYINGYIKIGESTENSYTIHTDSATGYNVSVRAWYEEDGEILIGDFSDSVNVATYPSDGVLEQILRNGDGSFSVFVSVDKLGSIVSDEGEYIADVNSGVAKIPEAYDKSIVMIANEFCYGNITLRKFGMPFLLEAEMPLFTAKILLQGSKVTISWDKIEGVSGYEIFKMNDSGEYVSIFDTTALSFSETVEKGSKNSYSVKYYIIKNGEKLYYSENLLEAVTAPEAAASVSLWKGDTITPNVDSKLDYTLESLNPNIVTANGKEITAVASGTAKIKVTGEWTDEVIINVTVRQAPTSLTLSTYDMIILETEKLTIKATLDSGAESKIKFTSSDPSKATVNDNGDVIAYKAGTVTVTAETENGLKAQCQVHIYPVDLRIFKVNSKVMSSSAWDSTKITTLNKGTQAFVLETKGAWLRIRYGGNTGWVYNKSFNTSIKNYSTIDTNTLPVIIDDWIFDNGTEIRTIFNYVRSKISYRNLGNGSVENLCVHVLRYGTGACYHYGALLYYMLDRAGYDTLIVDGIDLYTGGGPHRWNMVKVNGAWYHIDATPIIGLPDYYLVKDSDIENVFSWDRNKYPKTPV